MAKERDSLSASVRLSAILILEQLQKVKTVPQAGLESAKKYLAEGAKRLGRPPGTTIDDGQKLHQMMELLRRGEAKTLHDAAQMVAREMPEFVSHDSTVRRLLKKYPAFAKKYKEITPDE